MPLQYDFDTFGACCGSLTSPRPQARPHGLRNHRGATLIIVLCVVLSLTVSGADCPLCCVRLLADLAPSPWAAPSDLRSAARHLCNPALLPQGHGLVASVALDAVAGTPARLLFTALAAVCIVVSAPLTHGLAGRLRHQDEAWQFVNPGRGGVAFVALQAVGWTLYALSLVAFFAAFACVDSPRRASLFAPATLFPPSSSAH